MSVPRTTKYWYWSALNKVWFYTVWPPNIKNWLRYNVGPYFPLHFNSQNWSTCTAQYEQFLTQTVDKTAKALGLFGLCSVRLCIDAIKNQDSYLHPGKADTYQKFPCLLSSSCIERQSAYIVSRYKSFSMLALHFKSHKWFLSVISISLCSQCCGTHYSQREAANISTWLDSRNGNDIIWTN